MGPLLGGLREVCHCYVAPQSATGQSSFPAEGCHRVPISCHPSTLVRALHPSAVRGAKIWVWMPATGLPSTLAAGFASVCLPREGQDLGMGGCSWSPIHPSCRSVLKLLCPHYASVILVTLSHPKGYQAWF